MTIGGTAGVITEAYSSSGIPARRPAGSGSVFANTQATAGEYRYTLNFLFSTKDEQLRQSLNRFAASMTYRNWHVKAGDVVPRFSKYSLDGVTIRGGYLEHQRGPLLVTFLGGRSRRGIEAGLGVPIRRPSYARNMFAARVGYGRVSGSHVHLVGMMSRDKEDSVTAPVQASPAENVLISPQFGLSLLQQRLYVKGQLSASAFTRDTRATRTVENPVPDFLGLFTSRVGSQMDYATDLSARYTQTEFGESLTFVDQFTLLTQYERIQPGFVSLGRPYTRSDQAIFKFQPQVRLFDRKLQIGVDVVSRRNNLRNHRTSTLRRNQIALTTQAQLSPSLLVSTSYLWLGNTNTPVSGATGAGLIEQRMGTQTFMLAPVLTKTNQTHPTQCDCSRLRRRLSKGDYTGSPGTLARREAKACWPRFHGYDLC